MAPTSADVRTAWLTSVWNTTTVQDLGANVFMYDVLAEASYDAAKLRDTQAQINFFTCRTQRASEVLMMHQYQYTFEVRVEYYLQQTDVEHETFNVVQDRLETVDDLVVADLTSTWGNVIDIYTGAQPSRVEEVTIDGKKCWRGGYTYIGSKQI